MSKVKNRKRFFLLKYYDDYLFMLPYLLIFFCFSVAPVLISIGLSFTYFNVLEPPKFIGIENYFKLFLNARCKMKLK